MNAVKIKLLNLILLIDFIIYIFTNLIIYKSNLSTAYSILILCTRDIIIFLFSIVIYIYFCNSKVSSMVLFAKINNKIIKNSIIIGIAFYFIANGANLLFTRIFKFTMKSRIYLNNVYDLYNFGFSFFIYIFVYTVFAEMFFRGILNDAFKNFSYKFRIIVPSFLFSIFFFGLSQWFYGFVLGMLLMLFFDKVKNIIPVIIVSLTINILNYFLRLFGKKFLSASIPRIISSTRGDIFIEVLLPIIIILVGLFVCSIFQDKINSKTKSKSTESKNLSNVTQLEFKNDTKDIIDKYFVLFIISSLVMTLVSYIFLG